MEVLVVYLVCISGLLLGYSQAASDGLTIEALSSHVDIYPHSDAMLGCDVAASGDHVTMIWKKDGKMIQKSHKVSIEFYDEGAISTGILVIRDSGNDDTGTYQCIARTEDGRDITATIDVSMWEALGSGEEESDTDWLQWSGTIG